MKREFLKELGLEQDVIDKIMEEAGKDIEAEKAKVTAAEGERDKYKEQLDTATAELDKFKDVKPEELQNEIERLKKDLKTKDEEYAEKERARAFNDTIKEAIKAAGGKNEKAVMALLDIDTLKESQNQKEDIATAIEAVKKDNDYMFGSKEPILNPTQSTGGGGGSDDSATSAMRAAMGLPAAKSE